MATVTSPSYNHVRNPRGSSGILLRRRATLQPFPLRFSASPSPLPFPFLPSRYSPVCMLVPLSPGPRCRSLKHKRGNTIWSGGINFAQTGRNYLRAGICFARGSRIAAARVMSWKSWRTTQGGVTVNTMITVAQSLLLVAFESREKRGRICN